MSKYATFIAGFLLSIFMSAQLGVLHEFSHDSDSTECEICIVALDITQSDWNTTTILLVENVDVYPVQIDFNIDYEDVYSIHILYYHSSRPPPFTC